jgi:hypothetical protein
MTSIVHAVPIRLHALACHAYEESFAEQRRLTLGLDRATYQKNCSAPPKNLVAALQVLNRLQVTLHLCQPHPAKIDRTTAHPGGMTPIGA